MNIPNIRTCTIHCITKTNYHKNAEYNSARIPNNAKKVIGMHLFVFYLTII